MNKSKAFAIIFTVLLLFTFNPFFTLIEPVKAADTDYFVKSGGNDGLDGKSDANAWATIGKVNSNMSDGGIVAGDDIYFKRGDTFTDTYLTIGVNGSSISDPTVIGAYGTGDLPEFYGADAWNFGIFMAGKHNITIENIKIQSTDIWVRIEETCSNITVQNCNMLHSNDSYGGIYVYNHAKHIQILNNTLYNCFGDVVMFYYDVDYSIIENNTIGGGIRNNHDLIVVRGLAATKSSYNIIRNNNCWNGSDQLIVLSQEVEHCLIEDNIVNGTIGKTETAGIKLCGTWNNIIRNNIVWNCTAQGILLYTNLAGGYTSRGENNTFYHNTVYDIGVDAADACIRQIVYTNGGAIANNTYKNNIFYKGTPQVVYSDSDAGFDDSRKNNLWDTNIMYDGGTNIVKYNGTHYNVANAESTFPAIFQNNSESDPELADVANADFTLNSTSPCIDVGAFLTTCNGGGTGTAITVHDAKHFCDGFGLIDGDEITVGTDDVTITDVNYATNVLTITPSFTWVDGDNVSLRYNGSAPDIGAKEYGGNHNPTITNEVPTNGSAGISFQPTCNITVNDADGNNMDVTFASNYSGSWVNYQTNSTVGNGTYRWSFTGANSYSILYDWRVYCNDSTTNISETYHFTTIANTDPVNSAPSPADGATDIDITLTLQITVSDADGHTMNQTFRTNASGTWIDIAWNSNTGNASLSNSTSVTSYSTKYWWSSNVSDGYGGWDNDTYSFTTGDGGGGGGGGDDDDDDDEEPPSVIGGLEINYTAFMILATIIIIVMAIAIFYRKEISEHFK